MDRQTNGPTDRQMDGWTDKASYRDAWTHLKRGGTLGTHGLGQAYFWLKQTISSEEDISC